MISPVLKSHQAKSNVDEILQQLSLQNQDCFDLLVIAHNDRNLIRIVSHALGKGGGAILQLPQSSWDFDEPSLMEAIEWAIREAGVKTIVLLGHSLGSISSKTEVLPHDGVRRMGTQQGNRLIDNVIQNQHELACVKNHVAAKVTAVCEIPIVEEHLSRKTLETHGLLYIAESGTFVRYDSHTNTFAPMIAASAVG